MKWRRIAVLLTVVAAGCSAARPRTMRYVAVDVPESIPAPLPDGARRVEVAKTRVLPSIRLPRDVAAFLHDLEHEVGSPVLRNADVELTTSVCFFLCVNTDRASAEVPGP